MGGVDKNLSGESQGGRDSPFTPPTGPNPRKGKRGSKLDWLSSGMRVGNREGKFEINAVKSINIGS